MLNGIRTEGCALPAALNTLCRDSEFFGIPDRSEAIEHFAFFTRALGICSKTFSVVCYTIILPRYLFNMPTERNSQSVQEYSTIEGRCFLAVRHPRQWSVKSRFNEML